MVILIVTVCSLWARHLLLLDAEAHSSLSKDTICCFCNRKKNDNMTSPPLLGSDLFTEVGAPLEVFPTCSWAGTTAKVPAQSNL